MLHGRLPAALLALAALSGAALLIAPRNAPAFSLLGDELSLDQRDFRILDNFVDPTANDNQTPDANFPGHQGAVLAIWKACVEWGSELHGSGNGDPSQPGGLGSGGANFDPTFQQEATSVGSSSDNVHSALSGGSGGVLAFTEGGFFSSGWRIRYYESWTWQDGPEAPSPGQIDLQGVAVHEYGHALGLGHTDVPGSTMLPSIVGTGVSQRSIESDDVAGLAAIYGAKSSTKPRISSLSLAGSQLTLHGEDFSSTGNEVWFTQSSPGGSGQPVKLTGVTSTGGGTQIVVSVPGSAGPGDVLVKRSGSGHSSLSNAWPFDPSGVPGAPVVTGLSPASVQAVSPEPVTLVVSGNGFDTTTSVTLDGAPVEGYSVAGGTITLPLPSPLAVGAHQVAVHTLGGTGSALLDVAANDPPLVVLCCDQLFNGQTLSMDLGAEPGSTLFLAASPDPLPSVLPGFVSADIGNGFLTLVPAGTFAVPATGYVETAFVVKNLPPFTPLYWQAAVLDAQGTLPLPVSNFPFVLVVL